MPLVQTRLELWSVSFEILDGKRPRKFFKTTFKITYILNFLVIFMSVSLLIYAISVALQWICSTLVLLKIHQVKKKISKNKLNQNSANRFRKQVKVENIVM